MRTSVLRRVLAIEGRLLWRDPAVWMMSATLLALTAGAWVTASWWTASHEVQVQTLRYEEARRLADLQGRIDAERAALVAKDALLAPVAFGSRHGTSVGHYSGPRWMIQPLLPTTPLAIGEMDLQPLGRLASVDRWQGQQEAQFSSPLWQRLTRFDVDFVVAFILPLALIVLCAGVVSAEREGGTLALRIVQGGRPAAVGFGRVALRGGLLTLIVAVTVPVLQAASTGLTTDTALRLAVWEAALFAYAGFWLALIVWVDSGRRGVAVNLLACTGLWVVFVFVVPAIVCLVADTAYPIRSRADFERARRDAYQETWSRSNDEVLDAFYAAHPDIPPSRDAKGGLERYAIYQMRLLEIMRDELLPIERAFDITARQHRALVAALRPTTPILLLQDLSTTAAGTGPARVAAFQSQSDRFLERWHDFYATRIYTREPIDDLQHTPVFTFAEPPLSRRAAGLAWSLCALVLPAIGLAAWAFRRFQASTP